MKVQISLFAGALALLPLSLLAQPAPPLDTSIFKTPLPVNRSVVEEEMTLVSTPSPFEVEETDASPCAAPAKLFKADSNETSPDITERYTRARRLMVQGAWKRARLVLERSNTNTAALVVSTTID